MSAQAALLAGAAGIAAALAVGYALGRRSSSLVEHETDSRVCECGASMEGFSENARAQHIDSARHRRNMRLLHRGAKIIVAENWGEYRNCISHCIESAWVSLEYSICLCLCLCSAANHPPLLIRE